MPTVLIVEDEDSLRETLSRYLSRNGYDVIAAGSGYEAFEAGIVAAPDIPIAEWMLKNHIHGLHVSEVLRGLNPKLNTILITGFPSSDLLEESDRSGVMRLLEKPFDLKELQEAVREAGSTAAITGEPEEAAIAALAVDLSGRIDYTSERASEMLTAVCGPRGAGRLENVIEGDAMALIRQAESDWVEVSPVPVAR